ncbi:hypothetical protein QUB37_26810 [Microcoleus sp. AT3-A2]
MQPCYQGAIANHLLGRSNICDIEERMTQRLFEKNRMIPLLCRSIVPLR